jgi:hypothetical protein
MAMDAAKSRRTSLPTAGIVAACVLLSIAFKTFLLARRAFPFNADEAIVGLMARHILSGEWPTFFYGQAYLGSTDAFLAAAGFAVFGPQVDVIRAVQVLLYGATVGTTVVLAGRAGLGPWGQAAAGLLMAVPVVNTTLYTTVSIGGYGEALLLGNLILLLTLTLARGRPRLWWCGAWGVLAGVAFWTFGLTLVYSAPAILYLATRWKDASTRVWIARGGTLAAGFLLGAAPMVAWAGTHGPSTLMRELLGSAIAGASPATLGEAVWVHLRNFIFFGPSVILGARPPWAITPLAWPLLPLALVFWVVSLYLWFRRRHPSIAAEPLGELLAGVGLTLLAGFILTPFGADPSGRYFLPLSVVLAVAGAAMVERLWMKAGGRWTVLALAVPLVYALWGNLETAFTQPPGITTQFDAFTIRDDASDRRLIEFLRASGETRGYTTYWVAYPLAFLSDETLIFVPRLPYHADLRYTPRDDRYAPYDALVDASPRVAYITSRHPTLDEALREGLRAQDVLFEEAEIGGYHIFYRLNRALTPSELDIGLP